MVKSLLIKQDGTSEELVLPFNRKKTTKSTNKIGNLIFGAGQYKQKNPVSGHMNYLEGWEFGYVNPELGQWGKRDCIYMDECGKYNSEPNKRFPMFYGNLLIQGTNEGGEPINMITPLEDLDRAINAEYESKGTGEIGTLKMLLDMVAEGKLRKDQVVFAYPEEHADVIGK